MMTHFSVAVLTAEYPTNELLERIMHPYDEGLEVPRYLVHTRQELIDQEKERVARYTAELQDPLNSEKQMDYWEEYLQQRIGWTDEQFWADAIGSYEDDERDEEGNVYSTYNPQSKWDWYEIGGRFSGSLIIHDEFRDQGLVALIQWDKMRELDKKRQTADFAVIQAALPEEFDPGPFATVAVVTLDGQWQEQGKIGWWGTISGAAETWEEWAEHYFDRFLKDVPKTTRITILDCHI